MKIIKQLFLFAILLYGSTLQAQTVERSTFDNGGGMVAVGAFSAHTSLGQLFVNHINLGDNQVSEGFIQGNISTLTTLIEHYPELSAEVFPNPTYDHLMVYTSQALSGSNLEFIDYYGQVLLREELIDFKELDISQYIPGVYFLRWVDEKGHVVRQFRIIKM